MMPGSGRNHLLIVSPTPMRFPAVESPVQPSGAGRLRIHFRCSRVTQLTYIRSCAASGQGRGPVVSAIGPTGHQPDSPRSSAAAGVHRQVVNMPRSPMGSPVLAVARQSTTADLLPRAAEETTFREAIPSFFAPAVLLRLGEP